MTDPNAARAAELTGHRRYLELCDPGHPDYDPGCHESVRRLVADLDGPPRPPGLLARAANLAGAVAAQAAAGFPGAGPELKAARLAVCGGCPLRDAANGTCRACGCHLETKAGWLTSECPEGKWPAP